MQPALYRKQVTMLRAINEQISWLFPKHVNDYLSVMKSKLHENIVKRFHETYGNQGLSN